MPFRDFYPTLALGAALMLPPLSDGRAETGSVAYPKNPSATPATTEGGKSIATDKACSGASCTGKPGAPAGNAGATAGADQQTGIKTPATAYPGAPVATPATAPDGKAPH